MSSSRYIAAARQRRAEPPSKPVPQQRPPVTSIASQAAFQQQHQNNQGQRMGQPQQPGRGIPPQHMSRANIMNQMNPNNRMQQMPQQMPQQSQIPQQQVYPEPVETAMPIPSKLTISDAIGLITLRLGKVEQYIIDHQHDSVSTSSSKNNEFHLPENSEIVDKSVLNNIVSRLDSIEKKEVKVDNTAQINQLQGEIIKLRQILENFMTETERRIGDVEFAFSEMEKNFMVPTETFENFEVEDIIDDVNIVNNNVDVNNIDIQMEELDANTEKNTQENVNINENTNTTENETKNETKNQTTENNNQNENENNNQNTYKNTNVNINDEMNVLKRSLQLGFQEKKDIRDIMENFTPYVK